MSILKGLGALFLAGITGSLLLVAVVCTFGTDSSYIDGSEASPLDEVTLNLKH